MFEMYHRFDFKITDHEYSEITMTCYLWGIKVMSNIVEYVLFML
jgi:hypothetical protein